MPACSCLLHGAAVLTLLRMFRLKSAWIIRSWQKLLRALNDIPSWKMHTVMQLHRHDALELGRHIYTLEHINKDFVTDGRVKCGRCRLCFNPHHAKGCGDINTEYDKGEFVYQFEEVSDERFAGKGRVCCKYACFGFGMH